MNIYIIMDEYRISARLCPVYYMKTNGSRRKAKLKGFKLISQI
jgi:hypothetical protein